MNLVNLNRALLCLPLFSILFFGGGCTSLKVGESWKMLPEDQTFGLTLLWELPEDQLEAMLPPDQQPRIQHGKGVLMLFLASTQDYSLAGESKGPLGVAHLIIPLANGSIALANTLAAKNQAIFSVLKQLDFAMETGEVNLKLQANSEGTQVVGRLGFPQGDLTFTGTSKASKGNFVDLPQTTLVGRYQDRNILSGPESYRPIPFEKIEIQGNGQQWLSKLGITSEPDRVWVNVDFGVDFIYLEKYLRASK